MLISILVFGWPLETQPKVTKTKEDRRRFEKLIRLCLIAPIFVGCEGSPDPKTTETLKFDQTANTNQRFIGKPAARALDYFHISFDDLQFHLGHFLAAVSFEVKKESRIQRIYLWFNDEYIDWPRHTFDIDTIRGLNVIDLTIEDIEMEKRLVGKLAAEVLDHFKVGFTDLSMEQEPNCYLWRVSFSVKTGLHTHRTYLWLQGEVNGFRENMDWDIESIRKANVFRISTEDFFEAR